VQVSHLYNLSDFTGTVPYNDVVLHVDREQDEVYAVVGNTVRIFNGAGMETYHFDFDAKLGRIFDLAADEAGDILLLTYDRQSFDGDRGWWITRCDYRGEPIGRIQVERFPPEFASFAPHRMVYREGRFYLVSNSSLRVVVLDESGKFHRGYDLAGLLDIDNPEDNEIFGFGVDRSGNLVFTIAVLFKAFIVTPEETVTAFGSKGSTPGKFGIVAGIVTDDHGNYLVADMARGVVMVFDEHFQFVTEFGDERGRRHLIRPASLALGDSGKLYVTQARRRGVAVFGLTQRGTQITSDDHSPQKGGRHRSTDTGEEKVNQGTDSPSGVRTAVLREESH
jgi:hypothetical protein